MARRTDIWHFPRRPLAEQTLAMVTRGPAKALTLFGPRRMGKTTFLLRDLGPLAEARGHRVVYASFWSAPVAPLAVVLHALETSYRSGSLPDRARTMLGALAPRLKLSAPLPGTGVEASVDLTELSGRPRADLLLYLDDAVGRLSRPALPTVLLLDEVQELARSRDNRPLVHALRTSLDRHGDGIVTVFTGSSQAALRSMFSSRDAPFFHFSMPIELPLLGDEFVDHMIAAFKTATSRALVRGDALAVFERLGRNPEHFRGVLDLLMREPDLDLASAIEALRERLAVDEGHVRLWLALTALQRAVAQRLAAGATRPFTAESLAAIGALMGRPAPTRSMVQKALIRLETLGIADRDQRRWTIGDPELERWIASRPAG